MELCIAIIINNCDNFPSETGNGPGYYANFSSVAFELS